MKISEILAKGGSPFPSLEIVPPLKGLTKDELVESIRPFMEFSPRYINVTSHRDEYEYREQADGTYSRHMVRNRVSPVAVCGAIMSEFDVETVPHIICGGASADEIDSSLHDFRFMGIANVMALRGDSIIGEKRFTPVKGGYPEKHFEAPNIETDIANLKRKVDAGADYVVTQMFFDNRVYYDFKARCRAAGITVPIIPGLKPLSTVRQISMLPEAFSLDIPFELTEAMRKAGDDKEKAYRTGTEWCIAQCKDLLAHGAPVVHFYTMGRARNIVEILKQCF